MKRNKLMITLMTLAVSSSIFIGCSNTNTTEPTQVIEEAVSIDYNSSPEKILSHYSDEGMREFKVRYPEKERMDYALKQIGKVAPNFELTNISGETVKLSDLKGKKVLLEIVKTTCPICQKTAPSLDTYMKDNADVVIIPVFPKDDKESIESYYKGLNLEVNTSAVAGLDNEKQMTIVEDYSLTRVPTLIFIDESGKISYAVEGDFDEVVLKDYHNTAFGEKKLYDLVKKNKVELDKNGNVIKEVEDSTGVPNDVANVEGENAPIEQPVTANHTEENSPNE